MPISFSLHLPAWLQLLRKCENKNFPNFIKTLNSEGDRIIVGDLSDSFHYCKYKKQDNLLITFADDYNPRWLTSYESPPSAFLV